MLPSKKKIILSRSFVHIPQGVYKARRYWKVFKRHIKFFISLDKKTFWKGIIAGLVSAPMKAGKILLSGLLVDSIVTYYQTSVTADLLGLRVPYPVFYVVGIVILARSIFVLNKVGTLAEIKIRNTASVAYRKEVVVKFHELNAEEIDQEHIKDLVTKVDAYWWNNAVNLYANLRNIGAFALSIIIAFTTLLASNPLIAVIVMIVPTLQIYAVHRHYKRYSKFVDDTAPLLLERNYLYGELTGARTFAERKVNGMFRSLTSRFEHVADILSKGYVYVLSIGEKERLGTNLINHTGLTILKVIVLVSSLAKKVAVGHITYILGYIDSLYSNSYDFQYNIITMLDQITFVSYLYEFLDAKGFADSTKKGKILKSGTPLIELDKVSFTYVGSRKKVLDEASAIIKPGERVLILGKDGSGKSSLLSLMAGMYAMRKGKLMYNGVPIDKLSRGAIKHKMSVVPEDFARFYMTLRQNILLGDPAKTYDEALYKKALQVTGLDKWADKEGIDDSETILGNYFDGSVAISSGHWQRIAIARAVYRNRDIFLLDQPFTYIDGESVEEMLPKLLRFVGRKRTVILISEDIWHAESFEKILRLEGKKLIDITEEAKKRLNR